MFGFPGRIFHHVIRILVSDSSFFILRYSALVISNVSIRMSKYSNVSKSLSLFEFVFGGWCDKNDHKKEA